MASLKALKSIFLKFSVDSPCAGLYLVQRLSSPRLLKTNPECAIDYEVRMNASIIVQAGGGLDAQQPVSKHSSCADPPAG